MKNGILPDEKVDGWTSTTGQKKNDMGGENEPMEKH